MRCVPASWENPIVSWNRVEQHLRLGAQLVYTEVIPRKHGGLVLYFPLPIGLLRRGVFVSLSFKEPPSHWLEVREIRDWDRMSNC
tara:strand:- start:188 stop:442 length:255 start_codon:yes stop_codon:yes gene_type:complete